MMRGCFVQCAVSIQLTRKLLYGFLRNITVHIRQEAENIQQIEGIKRSQEQMNTTMNFSIRQSFTVDARINRRHYITRYNICLDDMSNSEITHLMLSMSICSCLNVLNGSTNR